MFSKYKNVTGLPGSQLWFWSSDQNHDFTRGWHARSLVAQNHDFAEALAAASQSGFGSGLALGSIRLLVHGNSRT